MHCEQSIDFSQLFENKRANLLEDFKCERCGTKHLRLMQREHYDFDNLNALIIRIETCHQTEHKLLDQNIFGFDPDNVRIPGNENIFRLVSFINFYPSNPAFCDKGGHYVCIRRGKLGWIYISDMDSKPFLFDNTLKNAYILFLLKIQ